MFTGIRHTILGFMACGNHTSTEYSCMMVIIYCYLCYSPVILPMNNVCIDSAHSQIVSSSIYIYVSYNVVFCVIKILNPILTLWSPGYV